MQLAVEQAKVDSLNALVEELRQRESDWQKAWHDAQVERKKKQKVERFAVDYTPAQADSLAEQLKLIQVSGAMESYFNDYISEPVTMSSDSSLDSLYAARLKSLVSPIHLPYNEVVRTYIQRYTAPSGLMSRILSRAQYYFPMIEEELLKAGLPVELRAMAVIESALIATAVSRVGATGLWQFMPATGKGYGLEINSMVDERYDPVKSTVAACKHLKYLYDLYNDWSLAIAAYNCGQGNVNKALARAGGNPQSFWDVYWFLPSETRGYVPAFIAASYAYAYHKSHNITYGEPPMPIAVDTVHVNRLLHLGQVSSTIDVPTETLKMLNPQYKLDIVPAMNKSYTLILPANRLTEYVTKEQAIFAKDSTYLKEYLNPENVKKKMAATSTIYYRVKKGDTLGAIASRHRVTTKQLMAWNGLKNANRLSVGQRLRIQKR
ncbi:MAG: transglycosylase SLT domain-containing protein [Alistipes sp.]|nr:LysM peptidoglycan-binding domain-containing protein [Rikenellaceae bacterium]MBQ3149095.1 transglycosylase SLT domain-containing protein [Alistipes sp.]MBR6672636.1 transglycosylase SLT domain-containing protein [Alistipes sp.]MBR7097092.1 transglycosylase SLT domain-containing protein [Alistipes sp.]